MADACGEGGIVGREGGERGHGRDWGRLLGGSLRSSGKEGRSVNAS